MSAAFLGMYSIANNAYFDGFDFNVNSNLRGMGIVISSSSSNVTFRRNKIHGITTGSTSANNALIFFASNGVGNYSALQDNEFYNVNTGYGILGYNAKNVLVEDNTLYNINGDGHAIGPKGGTQMWTIRNNQMYANSNDSIDVLYGITSYNSGDIEICYNLVKTGGGTVQINAAQVANGLPVYLYRNTFMDPVMQNRTTSTNGKFYWYENVIINSSSDADKIGLHKIEDATHLVISNNLSGSASDNIVDAQGYLTSQYSKYVGSRGHEIGNRPSAPTALNAVVQ